MHDPGGNSFGNDQSMSCDGICWVKAVTLGGASYMALNYDQDPDLTMCGLDVGYSVDQLHVVTIQPGLVGGEVDFILGQSLLMQKKCQGWKRQDSNYDVKN